MTTLSQMRNAWRAAVQAAVDTELDLEAIVWGSSADVIADPCAALSIVSSVPIVPRRIDETAEAGSDDLTRSVSRLYEVAVQTKVETVNGDLAGDALDLAHEISLGVWRQSALEALADAEVVLVDTGEVREHPYRVDGRLVHSWSFDATLRLGVARSDPQPVGTIGSLQITGGASGIAVPTEV